MADQQKALSKVFHGVNRIIKQTNQLYNGPEAKSSDALGDGCPLIDDNNAPGTSKPVSGHLEVDCSRREAVDSFIGDHVRQTPNQNLTANAEDMMLVETRSSKADKAVTTGVELARLPATQNRPTAVRFDEADEERQEAPRRTSINEKDGTKPSHSLQGRNGSPRGDDEHRRENEERPTARQHAEQRRNHHHYNENYNGMSKPFVENRHQPLSHQKMNGPYGPNFSHDDYHSEPEHYFHRHREENDDAHNSINFASRKAHEFANINTDTMSGTHAFRNMSYTGNHYRQPLSHQNANDPYGPKRSYDDDFTDPMRHLYQRPSEGQKPRPYDSLHTGHDAEVHKPNNFTSRNMYDDKISGEHATKYFNHQRKEYGDNFVHDVTVTAPEYACTPRTPNRSRYTFKKEDFPRFDIKNIEGSIRNFEFRLDFLSIVDDKEKFAAAWAVFDQNTVNNYLETAEADVRFTYRGLREYVCSLATPQYACLEPRGLKTTKHVSELIVAADKALACPKDEQRKAWMIMSADPRLQRKLRSLTNLPLKEFVAQAQNSIVSMKQEAQYLTSVEKTRVSEQTRPARNQHDQKQYNRQTNTTQKYTCFQHSRYGKTAYTCSGPNCSMYPPAPRPMPRISTHNEHRQHLNY